MSKRNSDASTDAMNIENNAPDDVKHKNEKDKDLKEIILEKLEVQGNGGIWLW
jgi:hypothetical protein